MGFVRTFCVSVVALFGTFACNPALAGPVCTSTLGVPRLCLELPYYAAILPMQAKRNLYEIIGVQLLTDRLYVVVMKGTPGKTLESYIEETFTLSVKAYGGKLRYRERPDDANFKKRDSFNTTACTFTIRRAELQFSDFGESREKDVAYCEYSTDWWIVVKISNGAKYVSLGQKLKELLRSVRIAPQIASR